MTSMPAPNVDAARRRWRRRIVVAAISLMGVMGVLLWGVASRLGPPKQPAAAFAPRALNAPLPRLWQVPAFSFRDQRNQPVAASDLKGKVWIADFIFTTCTTVCPLITAKMLLLQRRLVGAPGLRFVSWSVDPERDTVAALAKYHDEWNAGETRWLLLATDPKGLAATAEGMRVAVAPTGDEVNPILHTSRFFLVDAEGSVRGLYDSADDAALDQLVVDARGLLGQKEVASAPLSGQGAELFASLGCAACHDNKRLAPSLSGVWGRSVALEGGGHAVADAAYLRQSIVAPGTQITAGYLNLMPPYGDVVSDDQLGSLVDYVRTLSEPEGAAQAAGSVAPSAAVPTRPAAPKANARSATPAPPPSAAVPSDVPRAVRAAPAVLVTDPVCKMKVRVDEDTPSAEHAGQRWHFCSEACRTKFLAHPDQYLSP
jgi:protein SCO1/2